MTGTRRALISAAAALLCACHGDDGGVSTDSGSGSGSGVAPIDAPNVVVIAMESSRARSTTPYNPDLETTPFLVQLAAEGTLVAEAYTVVPHTTKALVPILCGIPPKLVKSIDETAPGAIPVDCLGERLAKLGFATLFIQPARASWEDRPGLVTNFGFTDFLAKADLPTAGFDESSYFGYEDDIMLGPAFDWIDAQDQDRPFFLSVLTLTSHHDYGVPEGFPLQPFHSNENYNNYLNTLAYTDRFITQLYAGLDARGLLDDTIFIVVGDHGEAFGEHGRTQHDNVIWDEGLHVPMILAGPGIPAGQVLEGMRQTTDIAPTILSLLDVDYDAADFDGRDLLSTDGHPRLFASCWFDDYCMMMREGDRKAIFHYDLRPLAVYDLAADPLEKTNVIDVDDNLTFAESAVASMQSWRDANNLRYASP
ncbi:MAG: sulfatase [Myxococcales bacterium]|nr:sulfatase [Myxococcales bacterium]